VYRDEQTGELGGLSRVRAITQDDAHIFCRYNQVKQEVFNLWDIIERFYGVFGIELRVRLSLHDPDNKQSYMGSNEQWLQVEGELRSIATERLGDNFIEATGDAAFYGPKLDFLGKDALGREHQVATIQFDFNQPEGFDLNCINEDGADERIAMIHCAVMGSIERFMTVMIEHTAGRFPAWVAPEQIRIITVNQEEATVQFAQRLIEAGRALKLRITVDNSNESVGKKIRASELMKIPYTVVIGEKEIASGQVTPRIRKDMEVQEGDQTIEAERFLHTVVNEVKGRVSKTSLQGSEHQ
jgi:threonyl-tRNA synthetase